MRSRKNLLDRILSENNMPRIFHHMCGRVVFQIIVQHPGVEPFVVAQWTLQDLVARNSKLRTTGHADNLGHLGIIE